MLSEKYQTALSSLNDAQRLAVTTTEGPVLVIAGPGTGKTELLTVRIAHILATTDTPPQNILCLTFTESAAHTMRQRLANLIGQDAYKVTISTYHGFGSELIQRYPEYFTSAEPDAQPIDDLGVDSLLRNIVQHLPHNNPLRFAESYIRDVKDLLSDFKTALLTPDDVKAVAAANRQFIQAATPLVQTALAAFTRISKKAVPQFQELATTTLELSETGTLGGLWQTELQAALAAVAESDKTTALTTWKSKWLIKNEQNQFVVAGLTACAKLEAAAGIYEQYLQALSKQHNYDYDDMILRAIKGLTENPELKFTLQEQYLYVLLDEFQDTNQAQLRLVELLADNPVNEGRPNVLAVGDDDQAIYAFQGADYSHMLAFYQNYRDVTLVPLTQNYRSHADILSVAQKIAEQIEERLHTSLPMVQKELVAASTKLPPKARLERHEFKSDVAQYAWVAEQIKQRIKKGLPASHIAVLAPQHKYLEPLMPYLQQADVPVQYEKRENILEDPVIRQLLQMTELVLALQHQDYVKADSLWPEILSSDYWQISTTTLWQLSWEAYRQQTAWISVIMENEELRPIGSFFVGLSGQLATMPIEDLMDYLIGSQSFRGYTAPLYQFYFGGQNGTLSNNQQAVQFWSVLSNLTVLRQQLRAYRKQDNQPLGAQDIIEYVAACQAANLKILDTSPYREAAEAVNLMTAYKAKGQEYEAVYVLACSDEVWSAKARGGNQHIALPANLSHIRYGGASEDERLRLFFVAITRAKSQLYLTNYSRDYAGKQFSRLRYLDENEDKTGKTPQLISPLLPEGAQQVQQNDQTPPASHELHAYWQQRHATSVHQPRLKDLLQHRLERYQLSPTHLNGFLDLEHGGPQQFFMNTLLRFPSSTSLSGHFGTAVHRTLEKAHYFQLQKGRLPTAKQLHEILLEQITRLRLPQDVAQRLEQRGSQLNDYLAAKAEQFRASDQVEFNFRDQGVVVGKAHLGGAIDKLIVDKNNKTITIVDYKTGRAHSKWSNSDSRLLRYRRQLYLYKLLVEGSQAFSDYSVAGGYLAFVEADEQGRFQDLALSFNDAEMNRIQQLTEIVWQHIMKLNFPDTNKYSADLKGSLQFEQDLLDGKV